MTNPAHLSEDSPRKHFPHLYDSIGNPETCESWLFFWGGGGVCFCFSRLSLCLALAVLELRELSSAGIHGVCHHRPANLGILTVL